LRQPLRRFMSVQVEVGDDQDIRQALCKLRRLMQEDYGRPWCKRRYGYYESKGTLGRKREKMRRCRNGSSAFFLPGALKLHTGHEELFERTGPEMAAGQQQPKQHNPRRPPSRSKRRQPFDNDLE